LPPLNSSAPPQQYALHSPPQQYTLSAPKGATAWQRSSRGGVLFLLAVAHLLRVRHGSSRVAVASRKLLGAAALMRASLAAAATYFFAISCFLRVLSMLHQNIKCADSCT
jgi:hypothetical protein